MMGAFSGGPVCQGIVCGWIRDQHQGALFGTRTLAAILEVFLALLFVFRIAAAANCKWQHNVSQNFMITFACGDGQLRIEQFIQIVKWNATRLHCAVVRRVLGAFSALLKIISSFPFEPDKINEWFTVSTAQDCDADEEENKNLNVMNVDKAGRKRKVYNIQDNCTFPDTLSEGNYKVLYHGTSHEGAENIISEGIDLAKGRTCLDFSNGDGFYLNDNLNEAIDWAQHKGCPAVLIFRFSKDVLDTFDNLDCADSKKEWQNIVREFRSGEPGRRFLKRIKKIDYIEGQMARYPPRNPYEGLCQIPDTYQLCVRSNRMAEEFDRSLHTVLFFSN